MGLSSLHVESFRRVGSKPDEFRDVQGPSLPNDRLLDSSMLHILNMENDKGEYHTTIVSPAVGLAALAIAVTFGLSQYQLHREYLAAARGHQDAMITHISTVYLATTLSLDPSKAVWHKYGMNSPSHSLVLHGHREVLQQSGGVLNIRIPKTKWVEVRNSNASDTAWAFAVSPGKGHLLYRPSDEGPVETVQTWDFITGGTTSPSPTLTLTLRSV
ncbi:hypothetical protein V8E36_007735 [Tilletia maclaganii]